MKDEIASLLSCLLLKTPLRTPTKDENEKGSDNVVNIPPPKNQSPDLNKKGINQPPNSTQSKTKTLMRKSLDEVEEMDDEGDSQENGESRSPKQIRTTRKHKKESEDSEYIEEEISVKPKNKKRVALKSEKDEIEHELKKVKQSPKGAAQNNTKALQKGSKNQRPK